MMNKEKEIQKIIEDLNKKLLKTTKDESAKLVYILGENTDVLNVEYIPTNIPALNEALGGGIPKGCITTIHGNPGAGKTSLCLSAAASIQKAGGFVLFVNTEGVFVNQAYMTGLDASKTIVAEPQDYAEQLVDSIDTYLYDPTTRAPRGVIDLVIIDSINGFVPKAVVEKVEEEGSEGNTMARRAKLVTDLLERIKGRGLLRKGASVLIVAQDRANISTTGHGPDRRMSGPKALPYMTDVLIDLTKKDDYVVEKGVRRIVGHTVTFKIEKNKITGIPKTGTYTVVYGVGIDDSEAIVKKALDWGYIIKEGRNTYYILIPEGDVKCSGIQQVRETVKADMVVRNSLRNVLDLGKPLTAPTQSGKIYVPQTSEEESEQSEE